MEWKSRPTLKMLCLISSPLRSKDSGLCGYVTTPATSVPFSTSHMALRLRGETHDAYPLLSGSNLRDNLQLPIDEERRTKMIRATCPTCRQKRGVPLTLSVDGGDLAVESRQCQSCGSDLTVEQRTEKVRVLVEVIMRKTGAPKVEAFTRALALMMP